MTFFRLLLRTVQYHRQSSIAVLLGVVIATAVICGALIVGDSVRESLRLMTLARLGRIDHALQSPRFFREDLAIDLSKLPQFQQDFAEAAPAISLVCGLQHAAGAKGGVTPGAGTDISRAGKVNLFGIDDRFWKLTEHAEYGPPVDNEVVLSHRVAEQLAVQVGDDVSLWLEIPNSVPRESLLGKREAGTLQLTLSVKAILPEALGLGRLGMRPNQQLPLNAFVALKTLQEALKLNEVKPSFRDRTGAPARVNTLFVAGSTTLGHSAAGAEHLTTMLSSTLQMRDLDLRIVDHPQRGYFALESFRMILEDEVANRALEMAEEQNIATSPTYAYVANEMSTARTDKTFSMYSVIAGLDFQDKAPFGPYEFIGPAPKIPLADDEIVINEWLAEDLQAKLGDTVKVKYHLVGSRGEIPEVSKDFKLVGILKFEEHSLARDRGVTPEVKGITDVKTLDKWDAPFPMDSARITDRDHAYWNQYRATPKAFVSLATAQKLWRSRYGKLTSVRIARLPGEKGAMVERIASSFLLESLPLDRLGLAFVPVKALGLQAAGGTTDFAVLFMCFSLVLIVSAAILVRLLFKLGIERRASEVGLLQAIGFAPNRVARLLFLEGLLIVVVGSLVGLAAGIGYASLMIYGLKTWWVKAIGTKFLIVSVQPLSLALGFLISCLTAGFSVWRAFGQLQLVAVRGLLGGQTQPEDSIKSAAKTVHRSARRATISGILAAVLIVGSILGVIPDTQGLGPLSWRTVAFFLGGMSSLVAGLSALSWWLDQDHGQAVRGSGILGLARLSLRNASRNRSRSVLTVWLIASATFMIVAVAAGQRNPAKEIPEKFSGNGGFTLVAESSQPILFDLNTAAGRAKLNLTDPAAEAIWKEAQPKIYPFRVKAGDEASCLNVFKSQLPTVLGAPRDLIERGGFRFVGMSQPNPWTALNEKPESGAVPVLADMNTLQYSMHKGVGAKLGVPNDQEPQHHLQIAGMFDGAVFQGVLVASEERFLEVFPEQAGFQYFLIEVAPEHSAKLSTLLETRLEPFGFDAERVADRLADFLSVQNTYLSTFQTLGGLGLLLGTLGLGAVMLRNVLERRSEIALLKSIGFTTRQTAILVLSENTVLLMWGLIVGTVSALLAMLPHLLSIGTDFPWGNAILMLLAVAVVGTLAASAAVRSAVKLPTLETLRREI
ncbi:MAG: FtsX-like permease family protein [Planctomycetaceae bacterium]|nr:FtsX-like permease family protein [Planctomycetaceae bacterium]